MDDWGKWPLNTSIYAMEKIHTNCYLCGKLDDGNFTRDHVPPKGLFLEPRPSNLITVPCCLECNNKHSDFDERLRIIASMPFDRNKVGQSILDKKVLGSTLAKGRQKQFIESLLTSMRPVAGAEGLVRAKIDAQEFAEGAIRITKGLLCELYQNFDYFNSTFKALEISQEASKNQTNLITLFLRAQNFERGQGVFQCWHQIKESDGIGVWMMVFYQCFGFFVFHAKGTECDMWNKLQGACQPNQTS